MRYYSISSASRVLDLQAIVLTAICILAAAMFVVYPFAVLIAVAAVLLLLAVRSAVPARLEWWQAIVAISLAGFVVLNYGFENLILGRVAGVPLLFGEFMMFGGLLLAIRKQGIRQLQPAFRDPIMRCLVFLMAFSALHLVFNVPRYGLYAFRDASLYVEGVLFVPAGYLWANERNGTKRFVQCLIVIFTLNVLYSFTLPWGETLQSISPTSGVFQPTPVLGHYEEIGTYLVAGALLCAWLADAAAGWSRRILWVLVGAQMCGLAVQQSRSMYLGIFIVLVLLFVLGERRKLRLALRAMGGGSIAIVALLVVISLSGIKLQGRAGEINADFLRQYALSVLSVDNSNARLSKDDDRLDWYHQVWEGTASDPFTLLVGQGFGLPLIDFEAEDGMPIRQPHNAAMGVFGRLGVLGLSVWLVLQVLLFKRFFRALRVQEHYLHGLILWLLMFYIVALLMSMVQPALEFSHYAVPFYFIVGFSLKMLHTALAKSRVPVLAPSISI
ncbi:MAG TPA: O-antigen ligase family protein [Bryobacteraceae bacterium]|jgi:hypothetical protein|nr:O-antigen ligase family protein [Bryobacteraceae bacterium]